MGMIWTFEIIGGICGDFVHDRVCYFFDILNMLQGFYIFLVFVCKRRVFTDISEACQERVGRVSDYTGIPLVTINSRVSEYVSKTGNSTGLNKSMSQHSSRHSEANDEK